MCTVRFAIYTASCRHNLDMYAENGAAQPRYSDSPLIQTAQPARKSYRPMNGSHVGPARQPANGPAEYESWIDADQLQQFLQHHSQQFLASSAALPAVAGVLLLLNHLSTVWGWLRGVGIIDTIALSCLAASAFLAAPTLLATIAPTVRAVTTLSTAMVRLPEMADNIATLSSTVNRIQQDPAPRHWLDMYYNMVSDIDNLLQELTQLRKVMAAMHNDNEPMKEKTTWMRKGSRTERR